MGAPVSCFGACSVIVKLPYETVGSSGGVLLYLPWRPRAWSIFASLVRDHNA